MNVLNTDFLHYACTQNGHTNVQNSCRKNIDSSICYPYSKCSKTKEISRMNCNVIRRIVSKEKLYSRKNNRRVNVRSSSIELSEGMEDSSDDSKLFKNGLSKLDISVLQNAATASAAAVADPIMSMVDTLFAGQLGTIQLAALGPNSAIFNAIYFLMSFTGGVVTTEQVGLAHARGNLKEVQKALGVSFVLVAVLGCLGTAYLLLRGESLLIGMGTNKEMMPPTLQYLTLRAIAVPAALFLIIAQAAYRAIQDLRTPCIVVFSCGLLNAVLDPILMFQFQWGVSGAAIATAFSQWMGVFVFAFLMLQNPAFVGKNNENASWLQWRPPGWEAYSKYLKDCAALLFRAVVIMGIYTLASITANLMGTTAAAANQLVNQLQTFQLTVLWAFLEVGQAMVVNAMGTKGQKRGRQVADRVIFWGIICSIVMALLTWLLRAPLPRIFLQDVSVLKAVESAMLPACMMILVAWNNALEGVLLGAGDTRFVVAGFLPAAGTGILMLLYVMRYGGGLPAIWWALTVYYTLLTVQYSIRYWVPAFRGPL